jgi:homoserine O-acetyltransferase
MTRLPRRAALALSLMLAAAPALAQAPAPREGVWVARDFRFHTGEVLSEARLAYTTLGDPSGIPVLVLHGTAGSARSLLTPAFGGQLFGPGQPLDASRHFVIIPDALGAGRSSKPSDGLRAAFPRYNYDDMVLAQYRLVTEGLGIRRLRLVLGNSMGGMHAWLWGVTYPDMMDGIVPMPPSRPGCRAELDDAPLLVETIRRVPAYAGGNYTRSRPRSASPTSSTGTGTNGGTLALQAAAPNRAAADRHRRGAPGRAAAGGCQRLHLAVGQLARLRPVARLERIKGERARDQRRRRRAQPARDRADGGGDAPRRARAAAAHPDQRQHARPRDHRQCAVLGGGTPRLSEGAGVDLTPPPAARPWPRPAGGSSPAAPRDRGRG